MDLGFISFILSGILLNDVCGLSVTNVHQQDHRRRTNGLNHDIQLDPTTSASPDIRPFKSDIFSTNQLAKSPNNHVVDDQNIPTVLSNNSSVDSATKYKHRRTSIKNSRRRQRRLRRKSRRRRKPSKKLRRSENSKNRSRRRRDRSGNTDKKSRRRNRSKRRKSRRRRKLRKTKRKSKNKVSINVTETSETQTNSTIRPETNSKGLNFKYSTLSSNTSNRTNSRTIAEILKQYRRLRSRRLSRLRQNSSEPGTKESTDEHKININSLQRDSPNHRPRSSLTSRPYMLYRRPIKSQIQDSRSLQMSRSISSKSSLSDLMERFKKYVPSGSISQSSDGKYRIRYNPNRPSGGRRWSYRPSVSRYRPYYPIPRPTPRPLSRYVYASYRGRRQYVPRAIHTFVYKYAPFIPLVYGRSRYVFIQPYNRPKPSQPILNNLKKCCIRYNTLCDEAMTSLRPTTSPPGIASYTPVQTPKPLNTPQPTTPTAPTTTSTPPPTTTTIPPTTTTVKITTTPVTTTIPTPKPTRLPSENIVSFVYRYAVFIPLVYRRKKYVFIKPENRPVPNRTILRSLRRCCFVYRPICDKAMANMKSQEVTSTRAPDILPEQKTNVTNVTKIEEVRPNTFTGKPTRENESEPFTKLQNSVTTATVSVTLSEEPVTTAADSSVEPVTSSAETLTSSKDPLTPTTFADSSVELIITSAVPTASSSKKPLTPTTLVGSAVESTITEAMTVASSERSETTGADSSLEPITTMASSSVKPVTTAATSDKEVAATTDVFVDPVMTKTETPTLSVEPVTTVVDSSNGPLTPTTLAVSSMEPFTTAAMTVASSEEPMSTTADSSVEPVTTATEKHRVTTAFGESSEEPVTISTLTDSPKEHVSPTELPVSSEEPLTTVGVAITSSEEPVKTSTLDDSTDELVVPTTLASSAAPSEEPATTVALDNTSDQSVTLAESSGVSVTTAPLNGSSGELVTAPLVTTEALEPVTPSLEQPLTSAESLNSNDTNKPISTSQRPVFILPDDIDGSGEIEERIFIPRVSRPPDTGSKP
ncbi:hypothetical protein SNE40_003978 [Patella caerulea]|uniref:Uncharacterized protein n=1 Tax=Patella caerulea TaxID=87958 RepID=A0AAN8Q995_PATCE